MKRAWCRFWHGGLFLDAMFKCSRCAAQFVSREEAGALDEFSGIVRLDHSRMLDEEVAHAQAFSFLGYRVVSGGQMVADSASVARADGTAGQRVMGGTVLKVVGDAPEPKVAKPIPAEALPFGKRATR